MKKLLIPFCALALSSCTSYYEIISTKSNSVTYDSGLDSYIYKNKDIEISYNFWTDGGAMFYILRNISNKTIVIDWAKSHIIFNGISSDYFNNASYTNTTSVGVSNANIYNTVFGIGASTVKKGIVNTKSYVEKQYAHIPPNASIVIDKASLISAPIFDCNLNIKETKLLEYNLSNSPIKFRNYITYFTDTSQNQYTIDNDFYISSLEFISDSKFMGRQFTEKECTITGLSSSKIKHKYPERKSSRFYIQIQTN